MKLNTAPQNEAILSNVGEIGEFRIRNSAKAFNILSSGLYANKIRAILRELGTNAKDSHVDAGKAETPFDVHLPNQLEPWFAIRDYGTGLDHEQVVNIYTTYFESTKTNSNDFVGCLGLGSKSPFSYTDNFTVTAIKNGRKGIYAAFLNDQGVPSIAQMSDEESDEPAGVEVRFAVNDRYDYSKFQQEARTVYTYFAVKPVITGASVEIHIPKYESENIVPGIHSYANRNESVAVMGSIAYPISVPNSETNLGELAGLLRCGLEIHFDIGELDFQASREGLSYIPQTIESIKKKLEALNAQLAVHIAQEADKIENLWERALYLNKKHHSDLWKAAAHKYCVDTKFALIDFSNYYDKMAKFDLTVEELASKYNISISAFSRYRNDMSQKNVKPDHRRVQGAQGYESEAYWSFRINYDAYFVINGTKIGGAERAKYHFRKNAKDIPTNHCVVYVLNPADKSKPVNSKDFLAALHGPHRVMNLEDLDVKPRETVDRAKNVSILKLEDKNNGYYRHHNNEKVWRDAGNVSMFDSKTTYYYLPLSGYTLVTEYGHHDAKELIAHIEASGLNLGVGTVYGVRKTDVEYIKTQKNWINLEDHVKAKLKNVSDSIIAGIALRMYKENVGSRLVFNEKILDRIEKKDGKFAQAVTAFAGVREVSYHTRSLNAISKRYMSGSTDIYMNAVELSKKVQDAFKHYPMLALIGSSYGADNVIADYVNLVDKQG